MQTWRRSRPHSCNVDAGHHCSHASRYATTGTVVGRDSAVNCGGSAVGAHRLAWLFRAVYTGTRPGLTPAIRAVKGWRGRRELAPRCSATQLAARRHDPGQTRRVLNLLHHTPHTPHTPHTHCTPTPAPTSHITTQHNTPQHQNTKRTSHTHTHTHTLSAHIPHTLSAHTTHTLSTHTHNHFNSHAQHTTRHIHTLLSHDTTHTR